MSKENGQSSLSRRDILRDAVAVGYTLSNPSSLQSALSEIELPRSTTVVEAASNAVSYRDVKKAIHQIMDSDSPDIHETENLIKGGGFIRERSITLPLGKNAIQLSVTKSKFESDAKELMLTGIDYFDSDTDIMSTTYMEHLIDGESYLSNMSVLEIDTMLSSNMSYAQQRVLSRKMTDAGFTKPLTAQTCAQSIIEAIQKGRESNYWEDGVEPAIRFREQYAMKNEFMMDLDQVVVNPFDEEMHEMLLKIIHDGQSAENPPSLATPPENPAMQEGSIFKAVSLGNLVSTATNEVMGVLNEERFEELPDAGFFPLENPSDEDSPDLPDQVTNE